MNAREIKIRRLEIQAELARLSEDDCELRRQMIEVESLASKFQTELAELDIEEANLADTDTIVPMPARQRAAHG